MKCKIIREESDILQNIFSKEILVVDQNTFYGYSRFSNDV